MLAGRMMMAAAGSTASPGGWDVWDGSLDGSNQNLTTLSSPNTCPALVRLDDTRIAAIYSATNNMVIQVGTISGTTISWADAQFIQSSGGTIDNMINAVLLDTDKIFVYYTTQSGLAHVQGCVVTISGTTPTIGTLTSLLPDIGSSCDATALTVAVLTTSTVFVSYRITSGGSTTNGVILSISGTTITVGTPAVIINTGSVSAPSVSQYTAGKILITYGISSEPETAIVNYSGTTIGTIGPQHTLESGASVVIYSNMGCAIDSSSVLAVYSTSGISARMSAIVLTLSGNTVTVNTRYTIVNSEVYSSWVSKLNATQFMVTYHKTSSSSSTLYGMVLTVSGTTITAGSEITIQATSSENLPQNTMISANLCASGRIVSNTATVKLLKRS